MPTFVPRASEVRNQWFLLNAEDQVLGRLASRAAVILMGKHKADYTPFLKTGDHVIVVNAGKVLLTGRKEDQKKVLSSLRLSRRHQGDQREANARETP